MIIKEEELTNITGGATSISGTLINAICKLVNTLLDLGRTVGSAIRTAQTGRKC